MKIMPGMARGEATVERLTRELGLPPVKTEYYLNDLAWERKLLDWVGSLDADQPVYYTLSHEGQEYLVKNDLL